MMKNRFWRSLLGALCMISFSISAVGAQETDQSEYTYPEEAGENISVEYVDALLAPIALYPDAVLAQVLMASTYPVDVIEAARWRANNPEVEGERLQNVLDVMNWDASVKALVTVPDVLQRMNNEPRWMQGLGEVVLSDQKLVTERVQYLRQRAKAMNSLASNDMQVIEEKTDAETTQSYIAITPTSREVIYVPYYDSTIVYGDWWWPSRPVYWYPPYGVTLTSGYYWGRGHRGSIAFWGGFNWYNGLITISVPLYTQYYRRTPVVFGPYNAWRRPAPMYAPPYYYHGGAHFVTPSRPWYRPSPPYYGNSHYRPPQYVRPPQNNDRPTYIRPPQGDDRPQGNVRPQQTRPPQGNVRPQQTRPQENARPQQTRPPQGNVRPQQTTRPQQQVRPPSNTSTLRPPSVTGQTNRPSISTSRPEIDSSQQGVIRQRRD